MKVSFLTSTYNHERYIEKCIQSVIDQDYKDVEQIIVDDGSTDTTAYVIRRTIAGHTNIKYYKQDNKGVGRLDETYNFGLSKCTGDIIVILEGDDWAYKNRASEHVKAFQDPEVIVSWGYMERWRGKQFIGISPTNYKDFETIDSETFMKMMFDQCYMPACSSAVRKSALDKIGGFKHGAYYVDYPTWLALLPYGKFKYIPMPLAGWGVHSDSYSTVLGSTARPDLDAIAALREYPDELKKKLPSEREITKRWKKTQRSWKFGRLLEKVLKYKHTKMALSFMAIMLYKMRSTYAIPTSLYLCVTPHCNLKCKYCMRTQYTPPGEPMSLDTLKYIIEEKMPYVNDICIQGLCEPYMNPELSEMLRYLHSRGIKIALTTNGTIPIKDLDALRGVDDFVISIDTADPETFTYLRGGAKLDRVMSTLKSVIEWKQKNGLTKVDNPPIHINSVITQQNIDQMPGLFDMLEPYADDLTYLMVDPVSRPEYQSFERPLALTGDEFKEKIHTMHQYAKTKKLNILGFDYMLEPSYGWDRCALCWYEIFIQPNGDSYFCMYDFNRIIGNVFTTNPLYIFNSPQARVFRKQLLSRDPPMEQCHCCNFARNGWQPDGEYLTKQGKEKKDVIT